MALGNRNFLLKSFVGLWKSCTFAPAKQKGAALSEALKSSLKDLHRQK
jgi:hypothetical protein